LIPTDDGILDWRSREGRPGSADDRSTRRTKGRFKPSHDISFIVGFLKTILRGPDVDDQIKCLQRVLGVALSGDKRQDIICVVTGESRSGKSTLLEGLMNALGDWGSTVPFSVFSRKDRSAGYEDHMMRVSYSRLVTSSESGNHLDIDAEQLKRVSGCDSMSGKRMYERTKRYSPQYRLFITTNRPPRIHDPSRAIFERILMFRTWAPAGGCDPNVRHRFLNDPEVHDALITFAAQGAKEYLDLADQGETRREVLLHIPQSCKDLSATQADKSDPVGRFIKDKLVVDGNAEGLSKIVVFETYQDWCSEEGVTPQGRYNFYDELREKGLAVERRRNHHLYVGVKFADPLNAPDTRTLSCHQATPSLYSPCRTH